MKQDLDWELVEKYFGKYSFFYNGPFSNWMPATFIEKIEDSSYNNRMDMLNRYPIYRERLDHFVSFISKQKRIKLLPSLIKFNCSEQYMMFYKALTFQDYEVAEQILIAKHPSEQKSLGRKVKNFRFELWSSLAKMIVYEGCYLKFTQDENLKEHLLKTKGTLLVEASPTDTIWGIGRAEHENDLEDVKTWRGANWLGEVLTVLRDSLERDLHDNPYG